MGLDRLRLKRPQCFDGYYNLWVFLPKNMASICAKEFSAFLDNIPCVRMFVCEAFLNNYETCWQKMKMMKLEDSVGGFLGSQLSNLYDPYMSHSLDFELRKT